MALGFRLTDGGRSHAAHAVYKPRLYSLKYTTFNTYRTNCLYDPRVYSTLYAVVVSRVSDRALLAHAHVAARPRASGGAIDIESVIESGTARS